MPASVSDELFLFESSRLTEIAATHREAYAAASPFPHVVLDDFLPTSVAARILEDFPAPDSPVWLDWRKRDGVHHPKKLGLGGIQRLGQNVPYIQHALFAFNSQPMVRFLEKLTGYSGLIPDPHYVGGGLHQILPGGHLSIHADFNQHPELKLYRRLNVLLYLNKDWLPEYGGDLELWDADMTRCVQSVAPIFNRCVIFNTDRRSFHGHPEPLTCPPDRTRKSLALYYYGVEPGPDDGEAHRVEWQSRPGEAA